jgi:hypothetical protein
LAEQRALVAVERPDPPYFHAVLAPWSQSVPSSRTSRAAEGAVTACELDEDAARHLGIGIGDEVWALPLE